jgi:hypothetical protein
MRRRIQRHQGRFATPKPADIRRVSAEACRGRIVEWLPGSTFGWVCDSEGERLFAHVADVVERAGLFRGDWVTYRVGTDRAGRKRAVRVAWDPEMNR